MRDRFLMRNTFLKGDIFMARTGRPKSAFETTLTIQLNLEDRELIRIGALVTGVKTSEYVVDTMRRQVQKDKAKLRGFLNSSLGEE